jgi:predicted glutamine amidotransferase
MCQLTFINTKLAFLNRLFLYNQWMIDTDTTNHDGCGVYTDRIFKSGLSAQIINNFDVCIPSWIRGTNNDPVIAHVRFATPTQGKKVVDDANAHPFETDKLVLAHNGVLDFKDAKNYDNHKGINIDSLIFLRELDARYNGNNFYDAIKETMALFQGTFAFLIYSKLEGKYFIARGWTKKLHYSFITYKYKGVDKKGLVANTDLKDFEEGLYRFKVLASLSNYIIEYTKPVEFKAETVFEVDNDTGGFKELGKITEHLKPVVSTYYDDHSNYQPTAITKGTSRSYYNTRLRKEVPKTIADFMKDLELTILDIDYICKLQYNTGLQTVTEANLKHLVTDVLPPLKQFYTKEKHEIWVKIYLYYGDSIMAINDLNLRFPYMINNSDSLKAALTRLQNEYARLKGMSNE